MRKSWLFVLALALALIGARALEPARAGPAPPADQRQQEGLVAAGQDDYATAAEHFRAAAAAAPDNALVHSRLGAVLSLAGRPEEALAALQTAARLDPLDGGVWGNVAVVLRDLGRAEESINARYKACSLSGGVACQQLLHHLVAAQRWSDVADVADALLPGAQADGDDELQGLLWGFRASAAYELDDSDGFLEASRQNVAVAPLDARAWAYLGTWHQRWANADEAVPYYLRSLELDPTQVDMLNNLGAAYMAMYKYEQAREMYERALALNPNDLAALANYGNHLRDEGRLDEALAVYARGAPLYFRVREALIVPPIIESREAMLAWRRRLEAGVDALLRQPQLGTIADPVSDIDTTHFYLAYQGLNDRVISEKLAQLALRLSPHLGYVSPLLPQPGTRRHQKERVRVGFTSRFFTENHPHGQVLHGPIRYLDRSRFEVVVLASPMAGYGVTPYLAEAADEVVLLPQDSASRTRALEAAQLDVLVFAEALSTPKEYYMMFPRVAPVQVLFCGNPVTAGVPSIDYFVSAEELEVFDDTDQHYSEQVVLLQGQGMWYDGVDLPAEWAARADFGLGEDWVLYSCLQSSFKLHPDFDPVLAAVLAADEAHHVLLIEGRRPRHMQMVLSRLSPLLTAEQLARVHVLPRVGGSDNWLRLLALVDVVLQPFPFDGSKTAFDALALAKPAVTLPTRFQRGRFTASFYAAMGYDELVAESVDEYVDIAVRLGRDAEFRARASAEIAARHSSGGSSGPLVVQEWARFLWRAAQ